MRQHDGVEREVAQERGEPRKAWRRASVDERIGETAKVGRSEGSVVEMLDEARGPRVFSVQRADPTADDRGVGVGVAACAHRGFDRVERSIAEAKEHERAERDRTKHEPGVSEIIGGVVEGDVAGFEIHHAVDRFDELRVIDDLARAGHQHAAIHGRLGGCAERGDLRDIEGCLDGAFVGVRDGRKRASESTTSRRVVREVRAEDSCAHRGTVAGGGHARPAQSDRQSEARAEGGAADTEGEAREPSEHRSTKRAETHVIVVAAGRERLCDQCALFGVVGDEAGAADETETIGAAKATCDAAPGEAFEGKAEGVSERDAEESAAKS